MRSVRRRRRAAVRPTRFGQRTLEVANADTAVQNAFIEERWRAAGWSPGRRIDAATAHTWRELYASLGLVLKESLWAILREYGGLQLRVDWLAGSIAWTETLLINPVECVEWCDIEGLEAWRDTIGRDLFPLGINTCNPVICIVVDERGTFWALWDIAWPLGSTFIEACRRECMNQIPHLLDADGIWTDRQERQIDWPEGV